MAKPAFVDFKKLKEQVGIRRILEHYGLLESFKERGERLSGRCPLCEGESESFRVSQEKNCFKCFRCDAGGNILDFIAAKEDCSLREAALRIAEWFAVDTGKPSRRGVARPHRKQAAPETPVNPRRETPVSPQPEATDASRKKQERPAPPDGEEGAVRKCNPPLTFQLKLDPDHPWFAAAGVLPETVAEFGLGFCSKGMMAGRIVFPLHDVDGNLVGYAGRCPEDAPPETQPLWKYPPGLDLTKLVFPIHRLRAWQFETIHLADDPLEVVLAWQLGKTNRLAFLGRDIAVDTLRILIAPTN